MKGSYKPALIVLFIFMVTHNLFAQQGIVKSWEGTLNVGMGNKLRVILNIAQNEAGKLSASLDSPDQGAKGIPVDNVSFEGGNIKLTAASIGGAYEGKVDENYTKIEGTWKQGGQSFPLELKPVEKNQKENTYLGLWQGMLKAGEINLRLVFKFFKAGNDSIGALLDSPDQVSQNIPASKVYYSDDSVFVELKMLNAHFAGRFNKDRNKIHGSWNQIGLSFPLVLEQIEKVEVAKRPQEPNRPFPYNEEEITFENKDAGITLAGTFTYPKEGKNFPAVVLVTGSGPQTRDEELLGHKPFLIWSDYLTRNGIAVLRFDDRGIGKSTGNYNSATTLDFPADAIAAVEYLKNRKEIDPKHIGIIGHSEGGIIAPIAANKCNNVAFIVLVAGPAVPGDEIILLQSELISRKAGIPEEKIKEEIERNKKVFDTIKSTKDIAEASVKLDALFDEISKSLPDSERNKPENSVENVAQIKNQVLNPWFIQFLKFDPRTELVNLSVPVLAMYGENDLQVPPSQNKPEMEKAFRQCKSKNYKVVVIPGLNHLFQECKTGSPTEYGQIEQTTSPKMLELMAGWIKEVSK